MEAIYFGNAARWYPAPPGPWIMTDQENNLVGCVNPDGSKLCTNLPSITWQIRHRDRQRRTAPLDIPGRRRAAGRPAVMFDGPRVNNSYDPMRKQGAILLGIRR